MRRSDRRHSRLLHGLPVPGCLSGLAREYRRSGRARELACVRPRRIFPRVFGHQHSGYGDGAEHLVRAPDARPIPGEARPEPLGAVRFATAPGRRREADHQGRYRSRHRRSARFQHRPDSLPCSDPTGGGGHTLRRKLVPGEAQRRHPVHRRRDVAQHAGDLHGRMGLPQQVRHARRHARRGDANKLRGAHGPGHHRRSAAGWVPGPLLHRRGATGSVPTGATPGFPGVPGCGIGRDEQDAFRSDRGGIRAWGRLPHRVQRHEVRHLPARGVHGADHNRPDTGDPLPERRESRRADSRPANVRG